jgi:transglutaminase superfamily protein
LTTMAQNRGIAPLPDIYELPGNDDFLSKPWLRWETRKGAVGGRCVEHLYHLGRHALPKLLNSSPQDISKYDLGEMNLICAGGLTGKHDIEIEAMLKTLDSWAERVAEHLRKRIGFFHKNRLKFKTLAQFRLTAMVHILIDEFGVRYSPDRINDRNVWTDPEDSFIHGILGSRRIGTCASLPVLLTAIGRRLGYPLRLVLAPGHLFCRWDTAEERINIEYDERGLDFYPDDFYRKWPKKWTPEFIEKERRHPTYLMSMTPQQELAYCAHTRAVHVDLSGRHDVALALQRVAYQLWPNQWTSLWVTHYLTKVTYPHHRFSHMPCEETVGKAAFERLIKKGAIVILPDQRRLQ